MAVLANLRLLIILLLTTAISISIAQAIQDPYIVYGYVNYSDGTPGSNLTVEIATTNQSVNTTSTSDGRYSAVLYEYTEEDSITVAAMDTTEHGTINTLLSASMINITLPTPAESQNPAPVRRRGGGGGFVERRNSTEDNTTTEEQSGEVNTTGAVGGVTTSQTPVITSTPQAPHAESESKPPQNEQGSGIVKKIIALSLMIGGVGIGVRYRLKHTQHSEKFKPSLVERLFR